MTVYPCYPSKLTTQDVIAATSFGGSFNLVETNDTKLKGMFIDRLRRTGVDAQFPFLKYIPFLPSIVTEMNIFVDGIIEKRRKEMAEKGRPKKDLLQILIDTSDADPVLFSQSHIREEMILFMLAQCFPAWRP